MPKAIENAELKSVFIALFEYRSLRERFFSQPVATFSAGSRSSGAIVIAAGSL